MQIMLLLGFLVFLVTGVIFSFVLYHQDKGNKKNANFLTSERLLVFIIEIVIAVIGFGLTLSITNANEREIEKDKAIQMLEQTIEYTDKQISMESSYLKMHNKGELSDGSLILSSVINMNYYNNILSNEVILQNADMVTYGEIMKFLVWIENAAERAEEIYEEEKAAQSENADKTESESSTSRVYKQMYDRWIHLKKTRDMLSICCDELSGKMSREEASKLRKQVKNAEKSGYECITTKEKVSTE